MAIVLVMLGMIFGAVLQSTRVSIERETLRMMQAVAADPIRQNWPGGSRSRLPYFTVRYTVSDDEYSEVRISGNSFYDLSDTDMIRKILQEAVSSEEESGYISEYNLRFYRTNHRGEDVIVFADVSSENTTMGNMVKLCSFIGLASIAVFLVISILLAR